MEFVLWLIAVILVVSGIIALVHGAVLYGIVLIVVGLIVGPRRCQHLHLTNEVSRFT